MADAKIFAEKVAQGNASICLTSTFRKTKSTNTSQSTSKKNEQIHHFDWIFESKR